MGLTAYFERQFSHPVENLRSNGFRDYHILCDSYNAAAKTFGWEASMRNAIVGRLREWLQGRSNKVGTGCEAQEVRLFETIVRLAIEGNADEIHLQPVPFMPQEVHRQRMFELVGEYPPPGGEEYYAHGPYAFEIEVSNQVAGELRTVARLPDFLHGPLLAYIGDNSDLSVCDDGITHKGELRIELDEKTYLCPVALTPSAIGKNVVIQIRMQ